MKHYLLSNRHLRKRRQGPLMNLEIFLAVEDKTDQTHILKLLSFLEYRTQRDLRRFSNRVAENTGRDRGKGDRIYSVLFCEREGVAITVRQKLSLGVITAVYR